MSSVVTLTRIISPDPCAEKLFTNLIVEGGYSKTETLAEDPYYQKSEGVHFVRMTTNCLKKKEIRGLWIMHYQKSQY